MRGKICMSKMTKTEIPVTIDIWSTYYTVRDYGDKITIEIPCRKYSDVNSWGLSFRKEKTSDAKTMEFLRKSVEYEKPALFPINGQPVYFSIEDILTGVPQRYGWNVSDF